MQGILDGAIIFFMPFIGIDQLDTKQLDDVASLGKMVFIALLGTVTLECALAARFWTSIFTFFVIVSYFLVYPYIFGYAALLRFGNSPDPMQVDPLRPAGISHLVLGWGLSRVLSVIPFPTILSDRSWGAHHVESQLLVLLDHRQCLHHWPPAAPLRCHVRIPKPPIPMHALACTFRPPPTPQPLLHLLSSPSSVASVSLIKPPPQ